jgi:hypothetical protein
MKFDISRDWCAKKGKLEAGAEIGAGLLGIILSFPTRMVASPCSMILELHSAGLFI